MSQHRANFKALMAIGFALAGWLALGPGAAPAAPGARYPQFGQGGVVRAGVAAAPDNVEDSVAVDGQGRVVVLATSAKGRSALLRFTPDGSPDPSFGGRDGSVPLPGGPWHSLAIQSDGRLVLAGAVQGDFAVARYGQDGQLDATFGSGGLVSTEIGPGNPPLSMGETVEGSSIAVEIQPDGRILAAGNTRRCGPPPERECDFERGVVALYDTSGTLDPRFGDGGLSTSFSARGNGPGAIDSLALAPDGKIVVGGGNGDLAIARLDVDGSLDRSFAHDGVMTTGLDTEVEEEIGTYGNARALAVLPDGGIVAVGEMVVLGLRPNGKLDPHFGSRGSVPNTGGGIYRRSIEAEATLVDPKGRILVAGREASRMVVARYLPNGKRDARFAGDGLAYLAASKGRRSGESATGLALAPDGRILVAGFAFVGEQRKLVLAKLRDGDGHLAHCHGMPAAIQGTPGPDRLVGEGPIVGFGGGDEIVSTGGPVCAGPGDDRVTGWAATVHAGPGNDRVISGGRGWVFGGPGDDLLRSRRGEEVADRFFGGAGADLLGGGRGPDRLSGGPGADTLRGGGGNDRLLGGPGDDLLLQGPESPPPALYEMSRPGFRVRLAVRDRFVTGLHLTVRLHCVRSRRSEVGGIATNHGRLPIRADGRFRHSESGRDLEENDYGQYLAGIVRPRTIVGVFSQLGGSSRDPCLTGKPGHRVIHFTARRVHLG